MHSIDELLTPAVGEMQWKDATDESYRTSSTLRYLHAAHHEGHVRGCCWRDHTCTKEQPRSYILHGRIRTLDVSLQLLDGSLQLLDGTP
jgi:hypothetical protein